MTTSDAPERWPDHGARAVSWALEIALRALKGPPQDQAAVALARRYAADIDEAALVQTQVQRALVDLERVDREMADRFRILSVRIEETHVLGLLGPKLATLLVELGMTPRSRASVTGKGAVADGPPTGNPLALVRGEYGRAAAGVDAS